MSLLVWLPLTQDLRNQGLSNVTVTNNGAIIDNNGKIGKCYYFDGNDHIRISLPSELTTIKNTTVCAWIKSTGSVIALGGISNDTNYANAMVTLYTSGWQFSGSGTYKYLSSGLTANNGTWHHVACTIDDTTITTYKDGAKVTSATLSSLGVAVTNTASANFIEIGCDHPGGDEYLTGYVNDFRIYNHALSPKEVELLSRGLVAHYPLNGNGRGQKNEVKNGAFTDSSGNLTGWNNWGACTIRQVDTVNGVNYAHIKTSGTKWAGLSQNLGTPLDVNSDYTLSFRAFSPTSHSMCFGFHWCNSSGSIISQSWFEQSLTTNPTYYTIKIRSGSTVDRFNMMIGWNTDEVAEIYFTDVKIEKGTVPTIYIPHSSDSAYSAMGYNSTTEYDVSGYQNDMTKTGTITYTSDSAKYSVASHFINGSYIMANQNCGEYLPKDGLTVNLWIKPTTWGTPISCTEGGGWNFESYNNNLQFQCYISGVGYKGAASTVPHSTLMDGKWHMLTGTFDRIAQQTKFYIDGELKGTNSTSSSNGVGYANNRLIISGEAQSTTPASSYFVGEESDVRIYATALTADQVLDLYKSSASVAKNGTLIGYEFIEN